MRRTLGAAFLLIAPIAMASDVPQGTPLNDDTPTSTVLGNPFVAPADWSLSVRGPATFIEAPEGGSRIVLVDVEAESADAAVTKAWAAYKELIWPLEVSNDQADRDGWSRRRRYQYQTSPNEKRSVVAGAMYANDGWTAWIYDMAHDVGEKRGAQVNLIFSSLLPKGYAKETFAGKKAHELTPERVAELTRFVETALKTTGVPGVGVGIIQDGKVVYAGGLGVRELGRDDEVDADTLFIIASNTKAMTTLLLAKLVDAGKLTWNSPVTQSMPTFRLGDSDTTSRVLVEHLICACTGLPRKDMEWILEFGNVTAADTFTRLADTQPTSEFGEMFQYSNSMAAAAGFIGGHLLYPDLELGAAYDKATQEQVFDPLEMKDTTFDFRRALATNHASAHGTDIEGKTAYLPMDINFAVVPVRPAGAAWSTVTDMLKYIAMEIDAGLLPNGRRYISKEALLERRAAKVPLSQDADYGMGLIVDETYGIPVVHHGGDVFGHHSDMMWLPEHRVGAVVLTNGDPGWIIRDRFQRKLLEVLFDGKPEADPALQADSKRYFEQIEAERKLFDVPADAGPAGSLASRYQSASLGEIAVGRANDSTVFDFGEWKSEVASQKNPDGSVSFVTIGPGVAGFEFVVGPGDPRTLILRDAQHEYVFEELAETSE